jgi:hypothetical protein
VTRSGVYSLCGYLSLSRIRTRWHWDVLWVGGSWVELTLIIAGALARDTQGAEGT